MQVHTGVYLGIVEVYEHTHIGHTGVYEHTHIGHTGVYEHIAAASGQRSDRYPGSPPINQNAVRMPLQCASVSAERSTRQSSDFLLVVWVLGKLALDLESSEVGHVRSSLHSDCSVYFSTVLCIIVYVHLLSHTWQINRRSPVCMRSCTFRLDFMENPLSHIWQTNGSSPVCIISCPRRYDE